MYVYFWQGLQMDVTDCAFCDFAGEEPKQFFPEEQQCGGEEQRAQPRLR
jgi:hypothetical protein